MKRILSVGLIGAALAAATALPVLAQPVPAPHGPVGQFFRQADADHNGRVTEAEAMDFVASRFASADADHDGGLTRQELSAFLQAQHQARRAGADKPAPVARPAPDAARPLPLPVEALFRATDANTDGKVTLDEMRPVAAALFRAADANGDGALEVSEVQRGPRHPGPGPRPAPAPAPGQPAPAPAR